MYIHDPYCWIMNSVMRPPNTLLAFIHGSQNYNLHTPDSDIDLKVVTLPSVNELLHTTPPRPLVQSNTEGGNNTYLDIRCFRNELLKLNPDTIQFFCAAASQWSYKYCEEVSALRVLGNALFHYNEKRFVDALLGTATTTFKQYLKQPSAKKYRNIWRMFYMFRSYEAGYPIDEVFDMTNHRDALFERSKMPRVGQLDELYRVMAEFRDSVDNFNPAAINTFAPDAVDDIIRTIFTKHLKEVADAEPV